MILFNLNQPVEMSSAQGGDSSITDIEAYDNRYSRYPSVVVRTQGTIKTMMMDTLNKLFSGVDFSFLNASRCSQAGTFYYDMNGKWRRAAKEECNDNNTRKKR